MPDPLQPLAQRRVSEEIVRPVAQLLLTEALVGRGRAERIAQFRLGPMVSGRRRFELQWQPPRRHSTDRPALKTIDGTVTLP